MKYGEESFFDFLKALMVLTIKIGVSDKFFGIPLVIFARLKDKRLALSL